ncbi:hypothetical protein BDB01DRAFT_835578 [Pilobolus umbonatus]|nr:hypothetical protein BDB01DRAFT_835578 [Pilobolus umbonatus]
MSTLPDPFVTANVPISAYMSGHENLNLAYVRYYGKKPEAVSATFKCLNRDGFIVTYKTADNKEDEVFIKYRSPVEKREDIRVVLEEMAKEAETALGMPSSMNGPPPLKALMKAAEVENSLAADTGRTPNYRNMIVGGANSSTNNKSNNNDNGYPKDKFLAVDNIWMAIITPSLLIHAFFAYASDETLLRYLPIVAITFRNNISQSLIKSVLNWAVIVHVVEASIALGICMKRGWYSPMNTAKWTLSTLGFGVASMFKLLGHGKKVERSTKKSQ